MTTRAAPRDPTGPIDERELHRLTFAELSDHLQTQLAPRVDRLGYLGEFFAIGGHQPAALAGFVEFSEALHAALPARWFHAVALTISTAAGNDYERHQHEQRCVALGIDREWIRGLVTGRASPGVLEPAEVVVRDLALAAYGRRADVARTRLRWLLAEHGPEAAVGVLLTIARYLAHSSVATIVGFTPPVPSIFAEDAPPATPLNPQEHP